MLVTKCDILEEAWILRGHVVFEVGRSGVNSLNEVGGLELVG